jgi:hypothetical protein
MMSGSTALLVQIAAKDRRIAELEAHAAYIRQQVENFIESFSEYPKTAEQYERAWCNLLADLKKLT